MTIGDGIFYSTTLLVLAGFVYVVSIRSKWAAVGGFTAKLLSRSAKPMAGLVCLSIVVAICIWQYGEYQKRPEPIVAITENGGIMLGATRLEVSLGRGLPWPNFAKTITEAKEVSMEEVAIQLAQRLEISDPERTVRGGTRSLEEKTRILFARFAYSQWFSENGTNQLSSLDGPLAHLIYPNLLVSFSEDEKETVISLCDRGDEGMLGVDVSDSIEQLLQRLGTPTSESISKSGVTRIVNYDSLNAAYIVDRGEVSTTCATTSPLYFIEEYGSSAEALLQP